MVNPFEPPSEPSKIEKVREHSKVTLGQFVIIAFVASVVITIALVAVSAILAIAIKLMTAFTG